MTATATPTSAPTPTGATRPNPARKFPWPVIAIVAVLGIPAALIGLSLVAFVVISVARSSVLYAEVLGTWHIEGTFVDCTFSTDGSFIETGLLKSPGKYEMLSNDRIRISPAVGLSVIYKMEFDGPDLVLVGESTPLRMRLTRKT